MEATTPKPQEAARADRSGPLEEITRSVVGLHKDYIGRGPTKARTYINDDLVVCVLQGGFTTAERTLREHGREEFVIRQRQIVEEALRQPLIDLIERWLDRRVVGFTSAVQPAGELSTLVFLLETRTLRALSSPVQSVPGGFRASV
jgi:uncharacterized protein YbcI